MELDTSDSTVNVDYLVAGTGAAGMAFVDSILTDSDATIAMVDRHHRPGGHWNDAYSFVRLHQPAAIYGVNSTELGSGTVDQAGWNAGLFELASGPEVLDYFDRVMRQRFLPSGRVHYLPMSDLGKDGQITSLLSGQRRKISATKTVDATYSRTQVPSTSPPSFEVDPEANLVPVNDLPRITEPHDAYVVIGAGKTGIDACLWLLENGASPDSIRWIMPRDSWLLDRANIQPGPEFFARFCKSLADQVEAVATADTVEEVFENLEASGELLRIDREVRPTTYHCATVSSAELQSLRTIQNVVRLGRVTRVGRDQIDLDEGAVQTTRSTLHVDCSAAGIPGNSAVPVFDGNHITLQWIRACQPTFSAALIGHIEATVDDPAEKIHLCSPITPPTRSEDWLRIFAPELDNRDRWGTHEGVGEWIANSRLDPFAKLARSHLGGDAEATRHVRRYLENIAPARQRLEQFLAS